jgi:hypothetical protein
MTEPSEPTDQADDISVLHLDRAIVARALANDTPCWHFSTPHGWVRLAFYDRGADATPPNVSAVEYVRGKAQITFAEPALPIVRVTLDGVDVPSKGKP